MAIYNIPVLQIANNRSLATSQNRVFYAKGADTIFIGIQTADVTANTGSFTVTFGLQDFERTLDTDTITYDTGATYTLANADATFLIPIGANLATLPYGVWSLKFTPGGGSPNGTFSAWISGAIAGIR